MFSRRSHIVRVMWCRVVSCRVVLRRRILHEIRAGKCLSETERRIQQTESNTFSGPIEPTELTTHRGDVATINAKRLLSLPGKEHTFHAVDAGLTESEAKYCPAPTKLILKIGYALCGCGCVPAWLRCYSVCAWIVWIEY